MKYCSNCGSTVEYRVPAGDTLPRYVCSPCGSIHYQNPKIVAGCIAEWDDRILLCRRAIEPRKGLWTIPAGFMENGETVVEAAIRETDEEARANLESLHLYAIYNIAYISQVYMIFRGQLADTDFSPGPESLETALFPKEEIPWNEMAFTVVIRALKRYFADRETANYHPYVDDIHPPPRR